MRISNLKYRMNIYSKSKGKITHHVPGSSKPVFKMENLLMSVRAELFGH